MSTLSRPEKGAVINRPRMPLSRRIARDFQKNWRLYLLFLPILIYFIVFKYACPGRPLRKEIKTRDGDGRSAETLRRDKPSVLRKEIIYLRAHARGQSFCPK